MCSTIFLQSLIVHEQHRITLQKLKPDPASALGQLLKNISLLTQCLTRHLHLAPKLKIALHELDAIGHFDQHEFLPDFQTKTDTCFRRKGNTQRITLFANDDRFYGLSSELRIVIRHRATSEVTSPKSP